MVSPVTYLRQVARELRKVDWPSREQTVYKTLLVLLVSIILATYLGGLDFLFQGLMRLLIQ